MDFRITRSLWFLALSAIQPNCGVPENNYKHLTYLLHVIVLFGKNYFYFQNNTT